MKKELKPIQKELLRLIKELKPLFDKYDIDYFACGGTMIGAVREKGFIPWDDDIDIFMARPDYDRLLEVARNNNGKIGKFDVACGELENSLLPFCKIFDKRYKLNAKGVEGDEDYLFIDVFPFDAIPDNEEERKNYYKLLQKKRKAVEISRLTFSGLNDVTKNKVALIPKYIIKVFINITNPKRYLRNYLSLCKKYDYNSSKYVWGNTWGNIFDAKITKDDIKTKELPFEDTTIKVMVGYDKYLTAVFGDYMHPPKKSEQESHSINIVKEKK